MDYKWLLTTLFGLFVIWTGLLRGIEAQAYKPNALWFCMATGLLAITGSILYRLEKRLPASILASVAASAVLGFYLWCFISQPEKDASYRVGLVIVAAIGQLVVIVMPGKVDPEHTSTSDE